MNKQNLWFLTLFSLILILGAYYITMPNSLLEKVAEEGELYSYNEVIIKADSRSKTWKTCTEFF